MVSSLAHCNLYQTEHTMRTRMLILLAAFISLITSVSSCKKEKNENNNAQLTMRLTDAPANYDAVYVDIQQIEFKMEGRSSVMISPARTGIYNLLSFRNGVDTLLVNTSVPAGKVEQIRLILGSNNSVVVNGDSYALSTPSGQTSGIKLNLHTQLDAGVSYTFWLDFDAGKSINETGNGKFQLKPVIRAYSSLTNGKIEGYILPTTAFATVYVTNGVDTVSAIPAADGHFVISGLSEGTWTLSVQPSVLPFATYTTNVTVSYGLIANVGVITLT